jgi:hypothetical protein
MNREKRVYPSGSWNCTERLPDILDHEVDDGAAVDGSPGAAFLASVSTLAMASVADGVTISANTGASHSVGWPVTIS